MQTRELESRIEDTTNIEYQLFMLEEEKEFQQMKYGKIKDTLLYAIAAKEQKLKDIEKEVMKSSFTLIKFS